MCLTAVPYSISTNKSDVWKPWAVKWLACTNTYQSSQRQAWDAPHGVGQVTFDAAVMPWFVRPGGVPSGHRGQIFLRDSGDIGKRCLDVAYQAITVPVRIKGIFLEAPLCDDSRVTAAEKAVWRFFGPENRMARDYQFQFAADGACGADDPEFRINFGPTIGYSAPISLPFGFSSRTRWTVDSLRSIVISPMNGNCSCQSHAVPTMAELSVVLPGSADDLPSTTLPSFPKLNKTTSR